jgi:aminomethyltransferase
MATIQETVKTTHLNKAHKKIGAKMTPFGGFEMPVWYTSIAAEHHAVRNDAGIFDISHMGVIAIKGADAEAFIQKISCNDALKAKPQKMIYSMMLNENGCILDDIMVGELRNNEWIMVVNASNLTKILNWIYPKSSGDIQIEKRIQTHSFFAIQGPNAITKFSQLLNINLDHLPKFGLIETQINHHNCIIMRTGYTGEDGIEISIPNSAAEDLWAILINGGLTPCGLGARDTLRLEAGLPLYGQELSEEITPLMTRYKWVVKYNHPFIGKSQLEVQENQPQPYTTVGLKLSGKLIPRTGYEIKEGGKITSGTLSPTLGHPIAMALINPKYSSEGSKVTVIIRGKEEIATVVKLPFI